MGLKDHKYYSKVVLKEDIDLSILSEKENMSVRSTNVCLSQDITSLERLIQYFLNHPQDGFLSIRNCGVKVNTELINICRKYEDSITHIEQEGDIESTPFVSLEIELKVSPIEEFLLGMKVTKSDIETILKSTSEFSEPPLFKILDYLINVEFFFNSKLKTKIFKETFNFYQSQNSYTLEGIGKEVKLTRERIRQIRETLIDKLRYGFHRKQFSDFQRLFLGYIDSTEQPYICTTEENLKMINDREGTTFSKSFIIFILSKVFSDDFDKLNDFDDFVNTKRSKKEFKIENIYLVNEGLTNQFDFKKFVKFLEVKVNNKQKRTPTITYDFIFQKFKKIVLTDYQSIKELITVIIKNEFNSFLEFVPEGLQWIQKNKPTIKSFIVDILKDSDSPLHYSEIYKEISTQGHITTENNVHSILVRETSTFGLKGSGIYELRSKGGLFGSIGDVTEKILTDYGCGIDFPSLKRLLLQELIVSEKSIDTVLFIYDKKKRFIRINDFVFLTKWLKNGQIPQSYCQGQLTIDFS
jgi:hypothetical protein